MGNLRSFKLFSIALVICMLVGMFIPISVFAEDEKVWDGSGIKHVTFSDSGGSITADNLVEGMGGKDGKYSSGKVRFERGDLIVTTKGVDYYLIRVANQEILVNPMGFKNANNSDVTKAMRKFTDAMSKITDSADTVQQIMADIQDTDPTVSSFMLPLIFESTRGDMFSAYKIMNPFLEVLSIALGVGAVLLILLVLFSTVMDLAYIGLPVWREAQAGKDGKKQPFGVSYEALTTVNEIEKGMGEQYRNAYLLYFRRRALTYIILSICIVYLICGGLSGIIGFVLSLVGGITGV